MNGKWSWVKAALALGILNTLILFSGNNLGTTTFYAQTTGYITSFFFPTWISSSSWTAGTCGGTTVLSAGWQWLFVLGLFLGALIANKTSKPKIPKEDIPEMWVQDRKSVV